MAQGFICMKGCTDPVIRYWNEIIGPTVRPYPGEVGPAFSLGRNNAWLYVVWVCRQFLEDDWYNSLAPRLKLPKSNRKPLGHHVLVQELNDALVQIWEKIPQNIIHHVCVQARRVYWVPFWVNAIQFQHFQNFSNFDLRGVFKFGPLYVDNFQRHGILLFLHYHPPPLHHPSHNFQLSGH